MALSEDLSFSNLHQKVAVPITRSGSSTSTTSTGTSTIPAPRTTETGTQPTVPPTTETGTQPASAVGSQGDGDVERISQEMRAGLENVFGQVQIFSELLISNWNTIMEKNTFGKEKNCLLQTIFFFLQCFQKICTADM